MKQKSTASSLLLLLFLSIFLWCSICFRNAFPLCLSYKPSHLTLSTTLDIYSHAFDKNKKKAYKKLQKGLEI